MGAAAVWPGRAAAGRSGHGRARRGGLPPRGRGEPHLHIRLAAGEHRHVRRRPQYLRAAGRRAHAARGGGGGGSGGRIFSRAEPHRAGAGHGRARAAALRGGRQGALSGRGAGPLLRHRHAGRAHHRRHGAGGADRGGRAYLLPLDGLRAGKRRADHLHQGDGRLRPCRAAGDGAAVGGACRGRGHFRRRAPDAGLSALARRRPARGRRLRRAHHLRLRGADAGNSRTHAPHRPRIPPHPAHARFERRDVARSLRRRRDRHRPRPPHRAGWRGAVHPHRGRL